MNPIPNPKYSDEEIEGFACAQLLAPLRNIPKAYLNQLRQHCEIFPHDYLFRLRPFAGQGQYGEVDCHEPGCGHVQISLYPRESVADGGRSEGIGGLSAFQSHIRDSSIHRSLRDARVRKAHERTPNVNPTGSSPSKSKAGLVQKKLLFTSTSKAPTPKRQISENYRTPTSKKPKMERSPIVIDSSDSEIAVQDEKPDITSSTQVVSDEDDHVICLDGESRVPLKSSMARLRTSDSRTPASSRDVKPITAALQRATISPPIRIAQPPRVDRNQLQRELQETVLALEYLSTCLKGAMDTKNFLRVKEVRQQTTEKLKLKYSLEKQLKELPSGDSFWSSGPSSDVKPSVYSSDVKPDVKPGVCGWDIKPSMQNNTPTPYASTSNAQSPFYVDHNAPTPMKPVLPPRAPITGVNSQLVASPRGAASHLMRDSSPEDERAPIDLDDADLPNPLFQNPELNAMTDAQRDEFYKKAIMNLDFEHNATVAQARKDLGMPETGEAYIAGMTCQLMPHQIIGVSWMVKEEKGSHRGGMLADEMGLGKTVEVIATMAANLPSDKHRRTTLIIAPLALITQWKAEIEEKCSIDYKILLYHGQYERPSKHSIQKYDVIITTPGQITGQWPDDEAALKELADSSQTPRKLITGPLLEIDWYRVVIDEAQNIRNPKSKLSRAVCALKSIYRWSLSGTPIFNCLMDIYPQLRFLKIRPYNDLREFRQRITHWEKKRPNLAGQRAQTIIKTFTLRRQKTTKLDGQPLIILPEKVIEAVMLDMSIEEREVYDCIEKHMQAKFNKFLRAGTVLKASAKSRLAYSSSLSLTCIPSNDLCLEEGDGDDADVANREDPMQELKRAIDTLGQDWVDRVVRKCQEELDELVQVEKGNPDATAPECPICSDALDHTARITKCLHTFCKGCINQIMDHEDHANVINDRVQDPEKVSKPCPNCRAPFKRTDTFLRTAFLPEEPEEEKDDEEEGVILTSKRKNIVIDDDEDELPEVSLGKGKAKAKPQYAVIPSAKLVYLLEELKRLRVEAPDDRVVILSQWTSFLDIVAQYLDENDFQYARYQGSMDSKARTAAVHEFQKGDKPLMLMSLKCGGVGLNLTRGNRVINLDLAWTPASEAQAFDRVHRLGQTKIVNVKRLMINNTVEQRMLELQLKKQMITDNALGEGSGKRLPKLTIAQISTLFGLDTGDHGF
ncbi:uncharacterized protein MELLADRAFT_117156 [Melampsora larici-populina 98AG31]|uniref:Uncharacterized protein n=1 Tax=Melampsora larici-populina (strain 98AG31 / pathotype 3-4-7) TaxID=747676 RepID=F4RU19_MELLP|nr:uncharacterized protein MELLADRAFT_117156 [Melampsora larici-populina 98AG31]EGG04160.1 hypothetical protein MELLADRAFT_117156 [Melampsora larici-populina 98AG31]